MKDFHHNIFSYYRGPTPQKQELYDQQLEDNTTKALVNTLENCNPDVAKHFFRWLGITVEGEIKFELQRSTIDSDILCNADKRLLLGIVNASRNIEDYINVNEKTVLGDSRPDAWLYGEGFVVLVESKIEEATLNKDQIQSHLQKLQQDAKYPPICQIKTWSEIHTFFNGIYKIETNEKDKWLIQQFVDYLEQNNMSEFSGFKEEMFEFFNKDEKDEDIKSWIRGTMNLFAQKILYNSTGIQNLDPTFYTGLHVGNFIPTDNHFWVAFGPENFKELAHQTISFNSEGVDIFINIELLPSIKKFRNKIHNQKSQFIKIISEIPDPFKITIDERKKTQKPRIYDYYPITTLESGIFKEPNVGHYGLKDPQLRIIDFLESLLENIQYPYFTIKKRIPKEMVLKLSQENCNDLVEMVLFIMKEFQPFIEFVNK